MRKTGIHRFPNGFHGRLALGANVGATAVERWKPNSAKFSDRSVRVETGHGLEREKEGTSPFHLSTRRRSDHRRQARTPVDARWKPESTPATGSIYTSINGLNA